MNEKWKIKKIIDIESECEPNKENQEICSLYADVLINNENGEVAKKRLKLMQYGEREDRRIRELDAKYNLSSMADMKIAMLEAQKKVDELPFCPTIVKDAVFDAIKTAIARDNMKKLH